MDRVSQFHSAGRFGALCHLLDFRNHSNRACLIAFAYHCWLRKSTFRVVSTRNLSGVPDSQACEFADLLKPVQHPERSSFRGVSRTETRETTSRPIDYRRFAYCSKCRGKFRKDLLWCPNCGTRLRHHPRGSTAKVNIERANKYPRMKA